jgi:hypothetical protein
VLLNLSIFPAIVENYILHFVENGGIRGFSRGMITVSHAYSSIVKQM